MKVIILDGGNKLVYRNKDDYTIKTSIGNFTDVNEAIHEVPVIKESKKIDKCVVCGKYFIKQVNNQKTCSKTCSIENRRFLNRRNQYKNKLLMIHQDERIISEYRKNKGLLPTGFNGIDHYNKLGEVILWEGIPKKPNGDYDWEYEHNIIKKLKKDLYKGNIIND